MRVRYTVSVLVTVFGILMLPLLAMVFMLAIAETDPGGRVFGYTCLAFEVGAMAVLCWLGPSWSLDSD
jgi:hypothetical protein